MLCVKAGLFITCLADVMRPQIAAAAARLMRAAGAAVVCPRRQTCCGQIAFNAGAYSDAADLAVAAARLFDDCDKVVLPSASCAGLFRVHWQEMLNNDANHPHYARLKAFSEKCLELSEFLQEMNYQPAAGAPLSATYHDCCAGLRELKIKNTPRELLRQAGVEIKEMKGCEECCGFGGAFSIKFDGISAAMADRKCENIKNSGMDTVIMGDLGCIMHLDGRLNRAGENIRVLHWAEVLDAALSHSSQQNESGQTVSA